MVAGDMRGVGGEVLVVGFRALKDFHAHLLADNLRRGGIAARAVVLDHVPEGRADVNSLGFARALDGEAFRAAVAAAVPVGDAERVAFPAVLGIANARVVWADMQARLGRPVFEVPTLPPSVPGMRVFNHFRETLRGARVQQFFNAVVVAGEREGARMTGVRARIGLREQVFGCDHVVLATGGFAAGGLALDSYWKAHEVALGLDVVGMPEGERFVPGYFDEQPMARAGIAVDRELHPAGVENVSVVGATLAGAQPWREKSGDGISLSTGHRAAELILGARRPVAEAAQ
jgi:glycerol-3-phosphate dehydrogenase subunit B